MAVPFNMIESINSIIPSKELWRMNGWRFRVSESYWNNVLWNYNISLVTYNDNKRAEVAMVWCTCAATFEKAIEMGHCVCLYVMIRWRGGSGNRTLDSIRSEKTLFDFSERREETKTNYGSFAGGFCPISPLILLYFIWNWDPTGAMSDSHHITVPWHFNLASRNLKK